MLQLAAALFFLLGLAHSILGERYILGRLFRRDNLPKLLGGTEFTIRTLRFAWHMTTVLCWGFAVLLWRSASGQIDTAQVLNVIGYTSMIAGLLPLVVTRGKHLSWIVLFTIGLIAIYRSAI